MTWQARVTGLFVLVGGLVAAPVGAQDPADPPASAITADTTEAELVFEREVFTYPSFARRNPFKPLVSGDDSGPRFEDLTLLGILHSSDNTNSVALFGLRPGRSGSAQAGETFRLRRGDRLGNVRVLAIQRSRVVLEVEEFGLTEQRSLDLKRPGEGGSQ